MRRAPLTSAAASYAEEMHAGQERADGSPFILHPLEVASLLHRNGAPVHLLAAGILHDVIEKTGATGAELHARFGAHVAALVQSVSDDDRIGQYGRRKAALRRQVASAGEEALILFAADKLSKVRELRREDLDGPRTRRQSRARRLRHYERSLALLEERLPHSPLVRELRDELGAHVLERAALTT
jgi:(p)ppGpp synthase/HD superfamily hydrolase